MSDPVDTDALRELLVLGAPPLSATAAGHDKWIGRVRLAGIAAADEVDRLRAVIEDAPHDAACLTAANGYNVVALNLPGNCTCWKADAL